MAIALRYTIQAGDTFSGIAARVGVTTQQMEAANPGVAPSALQVGQMINIPATAESPQPVVSAAEFGYWNRTWSPRVAPAGSTMGLAFSGWTDPATALSQSAPVKAGLAGAKFITLGGGNANGAFQATSFAAINAAIGNGQLAGYDGVAFDVEEGGSDLAAAFQQSFALARQAGLRVLVTVSHSAPYGIADAAQLMQAFFADGNIDVLSPQLYTTGSETSNDYATSGGVTWATYATARAQIVPSIVTPALYADAQTTFKGYGVTTAGFVSWS